MSAETVTKPRGLWNRGFVSLLLTQFFEAASDNIVKDTIVFAAAVGGPWESIFGEGGSGLIAVLFSAPFILLSAFGGRIADRYSKSRITILLKTLSLAVCALCAIEFARGSAYGAVSGLVAFAIVSSFFGPVKYGMIAELVEPRHLARANGIVNMATNVAVIVGGIVAGIAVTRWKASFVDGVPTGGAAWDPGIAMAIAVVLGFATCLTLPRLRPQNPTLPVDLNPFSTYIATLRDMSRSPLLAACGAWTFFYFVASVVLLILPDYSSFLGIRDEETAWLKAALGVAIGIGCVVAAYLDTPARRVWFVPLGASGLGLSFVLLGLAPNNFSITLALLVLTGLVAGFYIIPLQSMLQTLAPDDSRGRVLGTANGLSFVTGLLGGVLFFALRGVLHMPSNRVFLVVGAACLVMATVAFAWLRRQPRLAQTSDRNAVR